MGRSESCCAAVAQQEHVFGRGIMRRKTGDGAAAGGIDHGDQIKFLAAPFQPIMFAGVPLHQVRNNRAAPARYGRPDGALFSPSKSPPPSGQAGFYLARVLLRRREDRNVRQSMQDWLVLVAGLAVMLVWAGLMEAFFSQHHAPVLPYEFKVAVAAAELVLLMIYLLVIGRKGSGTKSRSRVPSENG